MPALVLHGKITAVQIDQANMNTVEQLLQAAKNTPNEIEFSDVISVIDSSYTYTPTRLMCGDAVSEAGSNEGSCKILGFARISAFTWPAVSTAVLQPNAVFYHTLCSCATRARFAKVNYFMAVA